jgi:hypothetical protein
VTFKSATPGSQQFVHRSSNIFTLSLPNLTIYIDHFFLYLARISDSISFRQDNAWNFKSFPKSTYHNALFKSLVFGFC